MRRMTRRGFATGAAVALTGLGTAGDVAATAADAAATPGGGPGASAAVTEMRGMWLATVANRDWPSRPGLTAAQQRTELLRHLDRAVSRRLNTVIMQVRPTADAFWPSPYEPWSSSLTGVQGRHPGWDPLGTAVTEAHRRGLELHAWFNPYRVANHADLDRLSSRHPARQHPGWVVKYGGKLFYNPGLPEVRDFVQTAMLDAVRRYPVDAVHWDDYFYPYPVAGQVFDDAAAYRRYGSGFPNRAAWRRDNTDRLVREMAARIKQVRPGVRFGISPFGVWRNRSTDRLGSDTRAGIQTYDDLHADTRKWVRGGWIDYICPQLYWHIGFAAADYAKLLPWWAAVVRGTGVRLYAGEALYKAGDPAQPAAWQNPAELSRHLTFGNAFPELRGHVFFSAKEVAEDRIGAMARVVRDHYPVRARAPR
ncbi:glycoside hydrolase family 10 protein [Streptomyces himalayensis]|uniref:Family 10 glycosylhydrolase n=1 Tax=Streptomyces himalayensis subsp. himalayensis TaxID=2756131 RepID=A0A7W0DJP8_9ACTN|nr:family 10 glycosylhydrolase [Streptomyces himalayensis]MBA2946362.1 family 10 glycosylhydrolase [Streptomyces himalayensis subsp. himalayensis]